MQFTPTEKEKLKAMVMYLVKKKHKTSDGHCGFHFSQLNKILDELVDEGKLQLRSTINTNKYFLNLNNNNNEH